MRKKPPPEHFSSMDRVPQGVKMIAVYGSYKTEVNKLEPVWKTRVDGIKQRYHVKSGKKELKTFTDRFEFYGNGRDISMAVAMTFDHLVPKRPFQVIDARDFLNNPYKYAKYGFWVTKDVQS